MQIETKVTKEVKWKNRVKTFGGSSVSLDLEPCCGGLSVAICGGAVTSFISDDLPALYNFYRDLGAALDYLQPGLVYPLPDDDPNLADALMVIDKADELNKEQP